MTQWKQNNMPHINWVIDADIANSAGKSEHPISSNCRNFLNLIKKYEYYLVITPDIEEEWKKHQTRLSRLWLLERAKRGFVTFIQINENDKFTYKIDGVNINNDLKHIAKKDARLIDAALKADGIIASGDDKARRVFCIISETENDLQNVKWVNPKTSNISTLCWDYPHKCYQEWKLSHKISQKI